MTEFEILSALSKNGGSMGFIELVNLSLADPVPDPTGTSRLIRALLNDELLSGSTAAYGTIKLKPAGELRLDQLRQQEAQRTADCADRKAEEKRGFRLDLICALAGSVATLLVELLMKLFV